VRFLSYALGLDRDRWVRLNRISLWTAMALVVAASVVLAWSRFGGVAVDAPQAFLRMVLVGVWGWLGLGAAIWLIVRLARRSTRHAGQGRPAPLERTLALVGFAHAPVLLLAVVILVAAGALQVFGLGQIVAVVVLGFWFPALLVAASSYLFDLGPLIGVAVVALPYGVWLATVGRHLLQQVQHLL
jgi:hypothetical protein